jgi:hypothetical protein
MIRTLPVSFDAADKDLWSTLCGIFDSKGCHELWSAFRFLTIWSRHYREVYGELEALSHLSNPDDPPDVIARFVKETVAIEITGIDPAHIRQSDALHNSISHGCGRREIPLSRPPVSKSEAIEMMYGPGRDCWESAVDRNKVWFTSIVQAVEKKIAKLSALRTAPGIVLLTGKTDGDLGEARAIEQAFATVRSKIPQAKKWTLATLSLWSQSPCFSAIDVPGLGFRISEMG